MVDGWCTGCHKPLGRKVAWDAADWVWHRKCWKAYEVYTPPKQCLGRITGVRLVS
jgi:hypothetical protein